MAAAPVPINAADSSWTRLYISPLNLSLLPHIIPPSVRLSAANVSYHSIETYPENTYGYVDLPAAEAQKLRNKLNGSFLKGMKVRVEQARPEKKRKAAVHEEELDVAGNTKEEDKAQKRARKEKKKDGVLPAVELPEHRQVKRGWVQPPVHEKKKAKSGKEQQDAEKAQMIFRTNIPPNVASNISGTDGKKSKSEKKMKGRKAGKLTEVKEFSKSTKYPTFLRDSKASNDGERATSFVDGKGWVDDEGNVVEAVSSRSSRRAASKLVDEPVESRSQSAHASAGETKIQPDVQHEKIPSGHDLAVSNDNRSASSMPNAKPNSRPSTSSSTADPSPAIPDLVLDPSPTASATTSPPSPKEIHPLEALFKRPRAPRSDGHSSRSTPRPAPIKTSFSFFDADDVQEDSENGLSLVPPQTPFTRRDLATRGIRSAAPTPDTAAIGRRVRVPWKEGDDAAADDDDDEEDEDHDDEEGNHALGLDKSANGGEGELETSDPNAPPVVAAAGEGNDAAEQTEFEKHFWAHRGEYNRGWKARKREARKEARQSENRRTGAGGVGR